MREVIVIEGHNGFTVTIIGVLVGIASLAFGVFWKILMNINSTISERVRTVETILHKVEGEIVGKDNCKDMRLTCHARLARLDAEVAANNRLVSDAIQSFRTEILNQLQSLTNRVDTLVLMMNGKKKE